MKAPEPVVWLRPPRPAEPVKAPEPVVSLRPPRPAEPVKAPEPVVSLRLVEQPAQREPPRPPALTAAEEEAPDLDLHTTWKAVVAELKAQKKEMLASGLAHGRLLGIAEGRVRLGFAPQDGMFRRQVERSLKEAEAAIAKVLGRSAGLVVETIDAAHVAEAAPSIAEEETERTRAREETAKKETREHPHVLAAMRLLGGTIEYIRVLEETQEEAFATTPDEGEDAGQDEA
ncbi:MAG TPA: hypothetical protein VGK67_27435 [Myxococcales bacterium]